ncbi:MAG: M15 family metallopeptidase [Actinomycetota bacterium]|nr:M15 family metallopeptidase [Actinomycetota bacterium]MDQ3679955.1 M15 family metallopeptidase [Actinomycetota bacterium]
MTVVIVLAGVLCLALGRIGGAAVARAQAVTAADAAALAGAAEGREAATSAAHWNGGRLVSYEELGADVRVRVELGGARATARARPASLGASIAAPSSEEGLAPAMRAALSRAGAVLGTPVPVTSGFRSRSQQAALYANRAANPYPVAAPGTSRHESGLAVDVPLSFVPRLRSVASQVGLCQPYVHTDPVHFELCTRRLP